MLAEVVASVASNALSTLRVAPAVRILLLCHDAVCAIDYVSWVAGEAGTVGVVGVAEGINGHAGAS